VKHERDKHYHEANLKNVFNAVSGLYVLLLYLYEELAIEGNLSPNPILLAPGEEHVGGTTQNGAEFIWNYRLRDSV
jgi:hypothetical protein